MIMKSGALRRLSALQSAGERAVSVFSNLVDDLKHHNEKLFNVHEEALGKSSHYEDVASQALSQIDQNNKLISNVNSLIQ
jgi:hypothetical protein